VDELEPRYPQDYHEPEEMEQRGDGDLALANAFHDCHMMGRDMEVGDTIALDNGSMHRCEASGWTQLPQQLWTARVQQGQERKRG
jgi:hypothetical protein